MNELTPLEKAVLLAVAEQLDSPEKESLVEQIANTSVISRELTGGGFFTNFVVRGGPYLPLPELTNRTVAARVGGLPDDMEFILFVKDGRIALLEGYSDGNVAVSIDWKAVAFQLIDLRKKYLS